MELSLEGNFIVAIDGFGNYYNLQTTINWQTGGYIVSYKRDRIWESDDWYWGELLYNDIEMWAYSELLYGKLKNIAKEVLKW